MEETFSDGYLYVFGCTCRVKDFKLSLYDLKRSLTPCVYHSHLKKEFNLGSIKKRISLNRQIFII